MMQMLWQMLWQAMTLVSAPAFWLMTGVVYLQIRGREKQKADMFQVQRESVIGSTVYTVLAGLAGGMLASLLLLILGVSMENIGLGQIWILALLLMMIRQRFFCFAYAGGLLAAVQCLTGWMNVQVSQILALVAVLHFTEAFLVLTTGHRNALPIYLQGDAGIISGGFLLQMTWPLPLIMLFVMDGGVSQPQAGFFIFPDYWPVIGNSEVIGHQLYLLMPVLAALGYSDAAVSCRVTQKTRRSAIYLLLYSSFLLLLVLSTDGFGVLQLIPSLFAVMGHEVMIRYGRRDALVSAEGPYRVLSRGVLVLDVQRGSAAARAGIRREDQILMMNGIEIENRQQFLEQQFCFADEVLVEYKRKGKRRCCLIRMKKQRQMGIITAPDDACRLYWSLQKDEGIAKFLEKKCEKTLKKVC